MDGPFMDTEREQDNYHLLGKLVVTFATPFVQKIFLARYMQMTGEQWVKESPSATHFFEQRISKKERKVTYTSATENEKTKLKGDTRNWDLTLLHAVLSNIDYSLGDPQLSAQHTLQNNYIKDLKNVRNDYSHTIRKQIPDFSFELLWGKAEDALIALGASQKDVDKIKASRHVTSFKILEQPTRNFTGRKELLEKIHDQMLKCSTKENCFERMIVLGGLGGMGKSELARMYAKKYIQDPIIQNIAWIDAEQETSMKASFISIARHLKICSENKSLEEIVNNVYNHFSNHIKNGLFIFDNSKQINDRSFGIQEYLPVEESLVKRPLIMLTAQEIDWDIPNKDNIINISELSREESIELLEEKFQLKKEDANFIDYKTLVGKLADAIQGYPLALALATSNIRSNKNWSGLKAEIDKYLEGMGEPGGDWVKLDQHRAATKYKLIMDNVWDVTLEKIKASKALGEMAIKLLNTIAYLPPDNIEQAKIEGMFLSIFSTELKPKVFQFLRKYSLIRIETRKPYAEVDETHLIRIHRLVQLTTRNKLDRENDVSYLVGLCGYFSYTGYEDAFLYRHTMMDLHTFLKERKWPENSIQFSIMFLCITTSRSLSYNVNPAWNLSQDIHTFLKLDEPEKAKLIYGDLVIDLFTLCMFWVDQIKKGRSVIHQFVLNQQMFENIFISMLSPSIKFALTSSDNPKSLQEHFYLLCISCLPTKIELNQKSTSQLILIVVSALSSTFCSSDKYISKIYKFMWELLNLKAPECLTLLGPVFQKHFEIYGSLVSKAERTKYWIGGLKGSLDVFFTGINFEDEDNREMKNGKMGSFKATSEFLEAFIEAGGHQILLHYITYQTQSKNYLGCEKTLSVVRLLALYSNESEVLVTFAEFLAAFADFTKWILEGIFGPQDTFTCVMCWFSLYSRQNPDTLNTETSIETIAPVLDEMLNNLERIGYQDYNAGNFDNEYVIQTFLETYKEKPECIAVKTAWRICKKYEAFSESTEDTQEIKKLKLEENVELIKQTNYNHWRLLTILAYLKNDTTKTTIEALFKFIFNQDVSEDAFTTLADHELLSMYRTYGMNAAEKVCVANTVKSWIKTKLLIENDYACLLGICNFEILDTLKGGYKTHEEFATLHECLKDFKWPQGSEYISLIFSLFLTPTTEGFDKSPLSLVEDVYEFLTMRQSTTGTGMHMYASENFPLLQICLFWASLKEIDAKHRMWEDPNLKENILVNTFLASIKPLMEHFLCPKTNLSLIQDIFLRIQMHILKLVLEMNNLDPELRGKIDELIVLSVNGIKGCVTENVIELYTFLWKCFKNSSNSNAIAYLGTILGKHHRVFDNYISSFGASLQQERPGRLQFEESPQNFSVFFTLGKYGEEHGHGAPRFSVHPDILNLGGSNRSQSTPGLRDYWGRNGPLSFFYVMEACKRLSDAEKNEIANCFFAHRGLKIVIEIFSYWVEVIWCPNWVGACLLRFLQMTAYELSFAETFITSPEFLDLLGKITVNEQENTCCQFECTSLWFALFARHGAEKNSKACDFFFDVVVLHLEKLISHPRFHQSVIEKSEDDALAIIRILETFLETFADKSELLAFKTAVRFLNLVQRRHILRSQFMSESDERRAELHNF